MIHPIANAPPAAGASMTRKPNLPAWAALWRRRRLAIAALSSAPGLSPPTDLASLRAALEQHQLSLVAGRSLTIW